jgi:glycosyltransferase involved in cell wall biosynthesis
MEKHIVVSVIVLSYNHKQYISECLDSLVSQHCDVSFEVLVGDDCSTDGTREIIDKYQLDYPEIVKPIYPTNNLGPNSNYLNCFKHCNGKYIAFCEGDDYWVDPEKLQKQVDFLEANPNYGGVCTNNTWYDQKLNRFQNFIQEESEITFEDLVFKNSINSQTILFEKSLVQNRIDWISKLKIGDWAVSLIITNQKPYYRLKDITAVYRVHDGGIHSLSSSEHKLKNSLKLIQFARTHLQLSEQRRTLLKKSELELLKRLIALNSKSTADYRSQYFKAGGSVWKKTILKSYFHGI